MNAYWFNPLYGKWWVNGSETENMEPFIKGIKTGTGIYTFNPPGDPKAENDWVLVLKK